MEIALAEETAKLAAEETADARRDADDARNAASAAVGANAGALRDARDEAAKLRLRERHWVALIECHRSAAALSLSSDGGNDANANATTGGQVDASELRKTQRDALEKEAATRVAAIQAVAAMLTPPARGGAGAGGEGYVSVTASELRRLTTRAERAEADAASARERLRAKSEAHATEALRAKRSELRANEREEAARREVRRDFYGFPYARSRWRVARCSVLSFRALAVNLSL